MIRLLLLAVGWLAVALGLLGVLLPLLPTTPFALLAAACFARSSARWQRWLLAMPVLGPALADWQAGRGVPLRAKLVAVALMWPSILVAAAAIGPASPLRWLLPALALAVSALLAWLPTATRVASACPRRGSGPVPPRLPG
jgi:uncharacterized membrane protein YbaN (DUF454 family)